MRDFLAGVTEPKPEAHTPTVGAVNRAKNIAIISDGESADIVCYFDTDGNECDSIDAVSCVAHDAFGLWYSIDLSKFEGVAEN